MALGDPYISVNDLKAHSNITDVDDDLYLGALVKAVSRGIEAFCGRQFNDAGTATARKFRPSSSQRVRVDDFHDVDGLVVAVDGQTRTDYELEPLNGTRNGVPGWPYESLVFDTHVGNDVTVTARWGWAGVPADVKQAALIQAARIFGRRYSTHGLVGQGDFVFRVSIRPDPDVSMMLAPYALPRVA